MFLEKRGKKLPDNFLPCPFLASIQTLLRTDPKRQGSLLTQNVGVFTRRQTPDLFNLRF